MIRVGVLGLGIGRIHAAHYGKMEQARVVAVADIQHELADKVAAEHGAKAYYDIASLLADRDVDLVDVCLPTYLHEQGVVGAAEAGKHVITEKPIGLSLEQAERMLAAVRRAGVQAMVAQVCRFMSHYHTIKEYYDRGDLGQPVVALAARLGRMPRWGSWFADPQLSGGALFDLQIHDLDYLYSLFGKPKSVYAQGVRAENGAWNHVLTNLDYGAHKALAECSFMMPQGYPFTATFRMVAEKGCAQYPYRVQGVVDARAAATAQSDLALFLGAETPVCPSLSAKDPYFAELEYFVQCLERGQAPTIATFEEACEVLKIALAARQSLNTGAVVVL